MSQEPKIPVDLTGVPETLLWTLFFRAQEAARPDALLQDPVAVDLVARIDYPFEARFNQGSGWAQWQALRALTFDQAIRRFLAEHPEGTVVSLGEGLETQFWRVDNGRLRWVGVDLPEVSGLRNQALPVSDRRTQVPASIIEDVWMRGIDDSKGLLITAQGLLMYLQRNQVHDLFRRCAQRWPGAQMLWDGVPRWAIFATAKQGGATEDASMRPPAMSWWMDGREAKALPGVGEVRRLHPPKGRGMLFSRVLPVLERAPLVRANLLSVWSARF